MLHQLHINVLGVAHYFLKNLQRSNGFMGWDMLRVLVLFFIDPFVDNGKILAKKVKVGFKTSYIVVT